MAYRNGEYFDERINFYTPSEKKSLIEEKKKVLEEYFRDIAESKKKITEDLINSIAFMSVELKNLEEVINLNGVVTSYSNGGGQRGLQESPVSKSYNALKKTYLADMKLLLAILEEDGKSAVDEEFLNFIKS